MILELDDGQELRLHDSLWTVAQARALKRLIALGGNALASSGGMAEETGLQILDSLRRIDEAIRADRVSFYTDADGQRSRSVMDAPIE